MNKITNLITIIILIGAALTACNLSPDTTVPTNTATIPVIPSATSGPTLTPTEAVDYYASVNGFGIRQSSFIASLLQFQAALQTYPELLPEGQTAEEVVLESLVQRALLAMAAREAGFTADQQAVEFRVAELVEQAGGEEAFRAWLAANGYTVETFLHEVPLEIEAAWQRDQIAATVPETMEQIRARQIFFADGYQASRAYNQLQAGIDFETILQNNSPNDPGYIDWFPRGYLLYPEIEETIFNLQPGQYSPVIETLAGYHIVYVLERDPQHPLSPEVRLFFQQQAVAQWLAEQMAQSQVEIYAP
jgi:peptidyl-prolyl cis-trans isomerase C